MDLLEAVRVVRVPHQRQRRAHAALAREPVDRDRDVRRLPLLADDEHALAAACAGTTSSSTIHGGRLTSQSCTLPGSPSYALRGCWFEIHCDQRRSVTPGSLCSTGAACGSPTKNSCTSCPAAPSARASCVTRVPSPPIDAYRSGPSNDRIATWLRDHRTVLARIYCACSAGAVPQFDGAGRPAKRAADPLQRVVHRRRDDGPVSEPLIHVVAHGRAVRAQRLVERVARRLRHRRVGAALRDEERHRRMQRRGVVLRGRAQQRRHHRVAAKRRRGNQTAPRVGAVQRARAAVEELGNHRERRGREDLIELHRRIDRRGSFHEQRAERERRRRRRAFRQ